MTTMQPGRPQVVNEAYYEEPDTKPPPMLATGPLAWVRENLFSSPMDTALTLIGTVIVISVTTSFLQWAIRSANWFSVNFNLKNLMVGRIEPFLEMRILALAVLIALIVGINLAAWARVRPSVWIGLAVVVALMFVLPPVINTTFPLSPSYMAAGQAAVVSGSTSETPWAQVGFIGKAGETISIALADVTNDRELAQIYSFTDTTTNALRNAASNRLRAEARIAELENLLASDLLTQNQRETFQAELESIEVPPPVSETLMVNENPAAITILDGDTLEPVFEGTVGPGDAPLTYTLPEDGWYVLQKAIPEGDESLSVLAFDGIYPIFENNFLRSVVTESGSTTNQRVFQFTRANDQFLVEGGRPRIDGAEVPYMNIIEHQYKGNRPFHDYLRLMVAPLLAIAQRPFALFLLAAVAGYYGARVLDRQFSHKPEQPRQTSRRIATWLWAALPVIAVILIGGLGILRPSDPQLWGGLLLTIMLTAVGIVVAFPIGIGLALGRRSSLPVVRAASTLYIEIVRGVPFITVLFMATLLVPFVLPAAAGPDWAPLKAMIATFLFSAAYLAENVRGGLQSLPPGQEEAAKALGLSGWQTTLHITLPQALRAVIPALVGQFISLFKDTSLVAIVGLIDLTGVANGIAAQTVFQGVRREPFVFISIIYFVFSYAMSLVSRRLEASGSGAARRV